MNPCVKELWDQAAKLEPDPSWEGQTKFMEKFAELIVQKCVNNLEIHSTCFDGDVGRGIKIAARLTKEHFGVKHEQLPN